MERRKGCAVSDKAELERVLFFGWGGPNLPRCQHLRSPYSQQSLPHHLFHLWQHFLAFTPQPDTITSAHHHDYRPLLSLQCLISHSEHRTPEQPVLSCRYMHMLPPSSQLRFVRIPAHPPPTLPLFTIVPPTSPLHCRLTRSWRPSAACYSLSSTAGPVVLANPCNIAFSTLPT